MGQLSTIISFARAPLGAPLANMPVLASGGSTPNNELEFGCRVLGYGVEDIAATETFRCLEGKPIAPVGFSETHIDGRR